MDGAGHHHRSSWRLTPWGWILTVALVVLVILAFAAPSRGVYVGLIALAAIWATLIGSSFPSRRARGMYSRQVGRTDFGSEEAERYRHERDLD